MPKVTNLSSLQTFMALVEHGTSKKYTEKEGVFLSTIWRKIDALEAEFRLKLFNRQSKGTLELTADGMKLYNMLFLPHKKMLESQHGSPQKPTIYVLGNIYVSNLFADVEVEKAPDNDCFVRYLSFTNITNKINSLVKSENILKNLAYSGDVVFNFHNCDDYFGRSEWKKVITLTVPSYLCATRAYLAKHPKIESFRDIKNHKFIMDKSGSNQVCFFKNNDLSLGLNVDVNVIYSTENDHIRLEMLKKGLGVTYLTEPMILKNDPADLVRILPEYQTNPLALTVYKNITRNEVTTKYINQFIDNFMQSYERYCKVNNRMYEIRYV